MTFPVIRKASELGLLILKGSSFAEVATKDGAKESVMVGGSWEIGLAGWSEVNRAA